VAAGNRSGSLPLPLICLAGRSFDMRKLYSGLSRSDATIQVQVWLEPAAGRGVINLTAFRAQAEIANERHPIARDGDRGLTELVPSLLARFDQQIKARKLPLIH